ncbi:EXS family-domain-containing protein [Mycena galericulata]|nr:EXS family-domain-containing protein [Mycena galericulata]
MQVPNTNHTITAPSGAESPLVPGWPHWGRASPIVSAKARATPSRVGTACFSFTAFWRFQSFLRFLSVLIFWHGQRLESTMSSFSNWIYEHAWTIANIFRLTPSALLAALCYAFWLSFARIGAPNVSPSIWPLVWLALAAVVMFDPFPLLFKPSRYWLIKNVGKLFKSGIKRVEFTDFWMGLVFTLSNLTLIGCVYSRGLNADWRQCGNVSRLWPLAFVLGVLPFLVRLIQSFKRYADSKLTTHLINAGKYGTGIISYLCYFIWRHRGSHYDQPFALWCLVNAIYTSYALTWDFLMDWSILRLHSRHFLLRQELVYTNHIFLYYLAIVTNTLIRFLWVLYIPAKGPDVMLRTFVVGLLEIVRRWLWNFYRLENEHIGNFC